MARRNLLILLVLVSQSILPHLAFSRSIPEAFVYATIFVANKSTNEAGTAFLVSRDIGNGKPKIFLVSNKHLIMPAPADSSKARASMTVYFNRRVNGIPLLEKTQVFLRDENGTCLVCGHGDHSVDVAVLDFTDHYLGLKAKYKDLGLMYIPEERLATTKILDEEFIAIGDRAIVLGFPLVLVEGGHSLPIARDATIATYPELDFKGTRGFLIDATMVRGSSGSPVFTAEMPYSYSDKTTLSQHPRQAKLIGIVSKTIKDWELEIKQTEVYGREPKTLSVIDVANLGVVFRTETIIEATDDCLKANRSLE